jgi:hypothetical protein
MTDSVVQQESIPAPTASQRRAARQARPGKARISPEPSRDTIARRAYKIYVKAGAPEGHFEQSWRQAQQDLYQEGQGNCGTPKCGIDKSPGPDASAGPVRKPVASASPLVIGSTDSTCRGAPYMPPEGHETPAQAFPRLAT